MVNPISVGKGVVTVTGCNLLPNKYKWYTDEGYGLGRSLSKDLHCG